MDISNFLRKYKYAISIGIILGIATVVLPKEIISPILIVIAGLVIGIFLISLNKNPQDHKFLKKIFICAFLLRITVALLLYTINLLLKGDGLVADGWCYSENGDLILRLWLSGLRDLVAIKTKILKELISLSGTLTPYDFWCAFVYFFTGKSPLSLVFINSFVGSLTVLIIYHLTKQLCNKKSAMWASILTAFWPSLFLWSIQNLKEPIIIFMICILIWSFVQIIKKFNFYWLFLIITSSIVLKEWRGIVFFIFYIIIFPIFLLFLVWRKIKIKFVFLIVLLGLFIFLCLSLFRGGFINFPELIEWVYQRRVERTWDASSAFLTNLDFKNPLGFAIFMPLALVYCLFAPFPWQLGSALQLMAIPEMLMFYLLIPFMLLGMVFVIKNKFQESIIIVGYIFVMFFVFVFLEGNIGTLFRHRAMVLPFIFLFAGIGIGEKNTL